MSTVSELVDLAEKCFRRAECEESSATAEALREEALVHLEEAYLAWRHRDGPQVAMHHS